MPATLRVKERNRQTERDIERDRQTEGREERERERTPIFLISIMGKMLVFVIIY